MNPRPFPEHAPGEPPECFNCGREISAPPSPSGHAPGRGAWKARCARCAMFTVFDIPKGDPAP